MRTHHSKRRRKLTYRAESLEPRVLLANPTIIDLLVVYTASAKSQAGGDAAIQAQIQGSLAVVNRAMTNSLIPVTVRIVDAESTSYVEAGDELSDLNNMSNHSALLNSVFALRNTYGADLVTLVTGYSDGGNEGGVAYLPASQAGSPETAAFNVVNLDALGSNNDTLAHEIGHNLGAGHERNNEAGIFPYSYGYQWTGTDGIAYHDIMAYPPGHSVPYYSNPLVSYRGVPTGVDKNSPTAADVASTFVLMAPVIAAYRATVVGDSVAPQAQMYQTDYNGSTFTTTIRFTDDQAVNINTITSSTLVVTTNTGTPLTVSLNSLDQNVNGSIRLATYTLTPTSGTPTLSQLDFFLQDGTLKDINGNTAPGGLIQPIDSHSDGFDYTLARDLGTTSANDRKRIDEQFNSTNNDSSQIYRIVTPANGTISVTLSGMTSSNLGVGLYADKQNAGYFNNGDFVAIASANGTNPQSFSATVTAGRYFVWVFENNASITTITPYQLAIHTYADTTAPAAALNAPTVGIASSNPQIFALTFSDNQELNASSTSNPQIRVDSSTGFFIFMFPISVDQTPNGTPITATYSLASPNGSWTSAQNGQTFTVSTLVNTVQDSAGNFLPAGAIGTFTVNILTAPKPLALAGENIDLKQNADHLHLDVFYNTTGAGSATQSFLLSQISSVTVAGTANNDNLVVDFSNGNPLPSGGLSFDGSTGSNTLTVIGDANNDTATVNATQVSLSSAGGATPFGPVPITYANTGAITFTGGAGNNVLTQTAQPGGSAKLIFGNATLKDTLNVNAGTFAFPWTAGPGIALLPLSQLAIAATASASVPARPIHSIGSVLEIKTLSITTGGKLDLNDNDMILDYTGGPQLSAVQLLINMARGAGMWNGAGLTSSSAKNNALHNTTLGAMEASDYKTISATFDGQAIDNTAVLVKYTYYGDANFNGQVDGGDYSRIDTTFNKEHTAGNIGGWFNGDFNGDGLVDGSDYALIDGAFNSQGSVVLRSSNGAALPPVKAPPRGRVIDGVL